MRILFYKKIWELYYIQPLDHKLKKKIIDEIKTPN